MEVAWTGMSKEVDVDVEVDVGELREERKEVQKAWREA